MAFWLTFLLFIGFTVVGELLRPKPKGQSIQPSGLGDFTLPTAEEGRAMPVAVGTVKIAGPNVVWYGDLDVEAIKQKQKTGLFSSTTVTTGFKYYLGAQLALCMGVIDALIDILFDDKSVIGGQTQVVAGKNVLRFGNVGTHSATIPVGGYASFSDLAVATQTAMRAAESGTWKVGYGFNFVPGISSEIVYSVTFDGVSSDITVDIGGAYQRGQDVAFMLANAMNGKEALQSGGARVHFTVDWIPHTFIPLGQSQREPGVFRIAYRHLRAGATTGVTEFIMRGVGGYDTTAFPLIGFNMGTDLVTTGADGVVESPHEVGAQRFVFAFGGLAGHLYWGDALTTCAGLFGAGTTATQTIGNFMCLQDRGGPNFATITDIGDDRFRFFINAPTLFGGDQREGGIMGAIDVYKGTQTQNADDYLQGVIGAALPAYRGLCYAVFRRLYIGTTSYPKTPAFVVRRCPNQLGLTGGDHNITGDANPAAVLYEMLTDTRWGLAIPTSLVDTANFQSVGHVLATEGLGISMLFDTQAQAADLVNEVCRHIDATMFTDPTTGKLKLVLARADYDPSTLPVLDEDSISSCRMSRPSWEETTNTVRVRYTSRGDNFTERIAAGQNLANIQTRNGDIAAQEYPFLGISNPAVAQKVVARVLRTVSYPLAALNITANRLAANMQPGSVFKLNWAPLGIVGMVCRITRIATGDPKAGAIAIDCVEDVFGITWTAYTAPSGSGWVDPSTLPPRLLDEFVEEAPITVSGSGRKIVVAGTRNVQGVTDGFKVYSDVAGGADFVLTSDVTALTPLGQLWDDIAPGDTEIVVSPIRDMDSVSSVSSAAFAAGANVAVIENEWFAFENATQNTDGTITLSPCARGVIDTAPRAHGAGSSVYFLSAGDGLAQAAAYGGDGDVALKLLPYNSGGVYPLAQATPHIIAVTSRYLRPFCPTAFELNGGSYPEALAGDIVVSWVHRDRGGTWDYDDSGQTGSPEAATHYRVRIYNEAGTLLHTATTTGTSYTYTQATERTDNGGNLAAALRVVVDMVQDGGSLLESWQALDWTATRADGSDSGASAWGDNFCGEWGI